MLFSSDHVRANVKQAISSETVKQIGSEKAIKITAPLQLCKTASGSRLCREEGIR